LENEIMLKAYREHAAERAALGIPPLPLDAKQVADLIELIKNPPAGEEAFLMDLLTHRVPPGVDDAAKVKASFLAAVAHGDIAVGLISKVQGDGVARHHGGRLQRASSD
jgi:aconitate hydratase 2/2-methylisocitrate dehydratase